MNQRRVRWLIGELIHEMGWEFYPASMENPDRVDVDTLALSAHAENVLVRGGVSTVGDLLRLGESGLRKLRGCGRAAAKEIREELARHGWRLTPMKQ